MKSKTIRRTVLIVGVLTIAGLASYAIFIEPNRLVLHAETLSIKHWPTKINGLKVAALGDIHSGSPFIDEQKLREIVSLTNAQKPDLIVLLGDYMVQPAFYRKVMDPEITAAVLKDLKAPLGTFAVLGNHDWWFDGSRVRKALEDVGIKVLDNEVAEVHQGDNAIWVAGLADVWTRPQNVQGTIDLIPQGSPIIAITHNPDCFRDLPNRVSLMLAAHTHGGQVNLPLFGRLVVPSEYGQRYAAGHIQENRKDLFVTTGIGTSILPIRFRVPPEIAVVTLKSG